MKIKKIELYKYKRFSLNKIEKLTYTPIRNNQLILGRNMSGKSSLLRELSPLPANLKKDYYEGGYKYIEIEHNQNIYICSSGYEHENKHSFKCNGIELNTGGTMKAQLSLVKEHFNLDNDIMKLLLNIDRFSTMLPNDRKIWINLMTKVDYNYAIGVYNKLKSRYRDLTGAVKLLSDQIAKKEAVKLKQEDIDRYTKDIDIMEQYLDHIKTLIEHYNNNTNTDITNIKSIYNKLANLVKTTDIRDVITLEKELSSSEEKLKYITEKLEDNYKNLDNLDKLKNYGDINKLEEDLISNKHKLSCLVDDLNKYITLEDYEYENLYSYYTKYSNVYSELISLFNKLEEYEAYRIYFGDKTKDYINMYNNLDTKYNINLKRINLLKEDISHMELLLDDKHLVVCEKCGNKWHNGYDPDLNRRYKEELDTIIKDNQELEKKLTKAKEVIENIKHKDDILSDIKSVILNLKELKPIWNYLLTKVDINLAPIASIITEIDKLNLLLYKWKDITSYIENDVKLTKDIKLSKELQEHYKEYIDINKLEQSSKSLEEEKHKLIKYITYLKTQINNKKVISELFTSLKEFTNNIKDNYENDIIKTRNTYLNNYIDYIKNEIYMLQRIVKDDLLTNEAIKRDSNLIQEYNSIIKVLKLILVALSPSEGLIAKSISGFIKVFVSELNSIINNIWTYDLEIIPCDITEDSDIDYYFKVKVDNEEIVEDISKLSSSGKEIVDLAFRIVFCRYMGLDVPLYLDEFGSTFDKSHRTIAYNVIDKVLSSDFDQLFLVCHYESLYGSFNDTDIVVIDSNNIGLDSVKTYNEVLKIS